MPSYRINKMCRKIKANIGKRIQSNQPLGNCSITALKCKAKGNLYIKGRGYLKQDLTRNDKPKVFSDGIVIMPDNRAPEGRSLKVIVLKVTNPDKEKPFEHLSLDRIDSILY